MKLSVNSIQGFNKLYGTTGDVAADGIDKLVEKIGAQLGAVEEVVDFGSKYKDVVVAKVVSCRKHENSDHLSICTIDDGGVVADVARDQDSYVQVVCGAPNVREGITVAWLPPGSTVPESAGKEPFVLLARAIRGEISNGMLASIRELALGDDHAGILEIADDIKPGTLFADYYNLQDDKVIDIENKMFTHRPDCFGFLGVSRELAGIQGMAFKSPDWYQLSPEFPTIEADELSLTVHNEIPELVPRFTAITMSNITVGPSPLWLVIELTKVGLRSINNIVDYTNFFMLETGQPLHAYDYDKVKALDGGDAAHIVVRYPRDNERIELLNGKVINPRQEAIMIATQTQPIGIAGVMGGASTETDEHTKNIILESANFDMYSVRRTGMAHGLFTDALTRFNKGQSPLQNLAVLAKVVDEIRQFAGGKVTSAVIDNNNLPAAVMERASLHPAIPITVDFINERLGSSLSADQIKVLLENVECTVAVDGDKLDVAAPFWRTDIETREDVVEEVGRLDGFDKLPLVLPKRTITPAKKDNLFESKRKIRQALSKAGANEVLTYSFVHGNLFEKVGQDKSQAFELSNALSPDLQYYRLSLTPSLLEKVHPNVKAGYDEFALFEIGTVHGKAETDEQGLPKEFGRIALVWAAGPKVVAHKYEGAPFYEARKFVVDLLSDHITLQKLRFVPLVVADYAGHELFQQMLAPYEPDRSAVLYDGERLIGVVGEYKRSVAKSLKLPDYCAGFELFLSAFNSSKGSSYVALPRFPKVSQDITFKVPVNLPYQELYNLVWDELGKAQPERTFPSLSTVGIYQRDDDTAHKQVTFHLSIASYEKTLTGTEVSKLFKTIALVAKDKFGAKWV